MGHGRHARGLAHAVAFQRLRSSGETLFGQRIGAAYSPAVYVIQAESVGSHHDQSYSDWPRAFTHEHGQAGEKAAGREVAADLTPKPPMIQRTMAA